jgi:TonB-dependent SusC/RagA subfamily outer membrane receptor
MHSKGRFVLTHALLVLSPALARAQLTITGRVTGDAGNGLSTAQVLIEGTTIGTATTDDGTYRLVVPTPRTGMVLLVRSIGYKPARQIITQTEGTITQDFRLATDVLKLGEVVVTASRGEAERTTLGTTIATVSGENIASAGAPQVDAALAGKVSGALVQQASGTPGGGTSVRIRGLSTLSRSAEPLWIVDGVIIDNSSTQLVDLGGYTSNRVADIDPNEIERIEIVKGAAAAALYGSRANDGVVQIFTKRGRPGALRTTFRVSAETDDVERFVPVNRVLLASPGGAAVPKRYDYQDEIFRNAGRISSTLSMSGGDDKTNFFLSGTVENQDGVIRGTDYRRHNLRLNLDRSISDRLKVGVSTAYITSKSNITPNGGLVFNLGVLTSFLFMPNSYNLFPDPVSGVYPNGFSGANALDIIANWRAPQEIDRFIGGLNLTAYPIDGMTMSYRLGYDGYNQSARLFVPRASSAPSLATGLATSATDRARLLNSDLDVSWVTDITPRLTLTHGAGINWQQQEFNVITARAEDLAVLVGTVKGSRQFSNETRDDRRTLGYYGQEQIAVDEKLFVTASLRSDAASAFGADERQQYFPKVGAALNLSDYSFWSPFARFANTLRLRAGYGFSGGQPAGSFDRLENYVFEPSGDRSGIADSVQQGNQGLKPERARELEVGTDVEMLNGRVGVELTYFDKRVSDLILPKTVRPSSGSTFQVANVGELENHGIELLLRTLNLRGPTLTWNSTLTFATNDPLVTKVSDGGAFFIPETFSVVRVAANEPPGHFFGTTYVRDANGNILTSAGAPIRDATTGEITGIPAIGPRQIIGDPNPDSYWSFGNEFGLGRSWSARVQFDGVRGGDVFNFDRRLLETPAFGSGRAYEAELLGEVPVGYFQARRSIFEEYIEDGSWTKLREVSVTWNVPPNIGRFLRAQSTSISLIGRNLKTWTDFTGWDPETNVGAQRTLVRGFAFATTPIPRSVAISVTSTF